MKFKRRVKYIPSISKMFLAYILISTFFRNYYKNSIWLIGEKRTEARDNGYHLFKYIRNNHPEIPAYYVITKDSPDFHKVIKFGNVIKCYSMKHYMYFLAAKNNINSQIPNNNKTFPFWSRLIKVFPFLLNKKQNLVFIQHGVIMNKVNYTLDYHNAHNSIISCTSEREREFIMKNYNYSSDKALLLGLCRFDNLHGNEKKIRNRILIMPTFRSWLTAADVTKKATQEEIKLFKKSTYFKMYINLLNDSKLKKVLAEFNYEIIFYPHYSLQSYIDLFKSHIDNKKVLIADRQNYDVQNLLIESSVLITDYSSVFFDFAYMKKPTLFFQFDTKKFRDKHYKEGYFSYEKDGFGPVLKNSSDLIINLEEILKRNSKISKKYTDRIDDFFTIRDKNNCKRTFEAIKKLP